MSVDNPLISVVIPCYNEEAYISDAIESMLNQTYELFEIIVVDDGSTDDTVQIVNQHDDSRLHLIGNQSNSGRSAARNKGLDHAHGDYIIFHDADDMSHPDRFTLQLDQFTDNSDLLAVGSMMQPIDVDGKSLNYEVEIPPEHFDVDHILKNGGLCSHAATMFRTDIIRQLGGYRLPFERAEDFDLWLRFFENYNSDNFGFVGKKLYYYRIYPENSRHFFDGSDFTTMAKEAARIRALGGSDAEILQDSRLSSKKRPEISERMLHSSYHYRLAKMALSQSEHKSFINHFHESIVETPFLPKLWLGITFSFFPSTIRRLMLRAYHHLKYNFEF